MPVEHPILFVTPLVEAVRQGLKAQTRRLVLPSSSWMDEDTIQHARRFQHIREGVWSIQDHDGDQVGTVRCPWGVPGHHLWVRETHAFLDLATGYESSVAIKKLHSPKKHLSPVYKAHLSDFEESLISKWRPSLHMPRWAARTFLELTDIRIERLWAITEEDAKAEGVVPFFEHFPCIGRDQRIIGSGERCADFPYRASFAVLWDEISDGGPLWKDNPWVWALSFTKVGVDAA